MLKFKYTFGELGLVKNVSYSRNRWSKVEKCRNLVDQSLRLTLRKKGRDAALELWGNSLAEKLARCADAQKRGKNLTQEMRARGWRGTSRVTS